MTCFPFGPVLCPYPTLLVVAVVPGFGDEVPKIENEVGEFREDDEG